MILHKEKKYIECETCKHNSICKRNLSRNCLIIKNGLVVKTINGVKLTSFMNYEYALWEPVIDNNLLEDELFEI